MICGFAVIVGDGPGRIIYFHFLVKFEHSSSLPDHFACPFRRTPQFPERTPCGPRRSEFPRGNTGSSAVLGCSGIFLNLTFVSFMKKVAMERR